MSLWFAFCFSILNFYQEIKELILNAEKICDLLTSFISAWGDLSTLQKSLIRKYDIELYKTVIDTIGESKYNLIKDDGKNQVTGAYYIRDAVKPNCLIKPIKTLRELQDKIRQINKKLEPLHNKKKYKKQLFKIIPSN